MYMLVDQVSATGSRRIEKRERVQVVIREQDDVVIVAASQVMFETTKYEGVTKKTNQSLGTTFYFLQKKV